MNVLAIGAHPDDIEFGCAGTLGKYAEGGVKVYLLVLTNGEEGGEGARRRLEQIDAVGILRAEKVFFGGYRDTQIPLDKTIIGRIEDVLAAVNPQVIFVHYPDDTHQDHRTIAAATISATRYVKNVLFYEGPTTQSFTPTVFVDIGKYVDVKIACLEAHASQVLKTNIQDLSIVEIALAAATFRGIQARVRHAEGFVPLRLLIDDGHF